MHGGVTPFFLREKVVFSTCHVIVLIPDYREERMHGSPLYTMKMQGLTTSDQRFGMEAPPGDSYISPFIRWPKSMFG